MPFFSDYGYYHGSAPFSSSQYYNQMLPYSGSNISRPMSRVQPRNYNSIIVEQTLRAIRRGPGAVAARHYSRPVHINTSEIDVTSPRRPLHRPSVIETAINDDKNEDNTGGNIHRGRTVVRLHTKNKRTEKFPTDEPKVMSGLPEILEFATCTATVLEEGLAKKGTIKRHRSAGIKVLANDDRRTSVTDQILREQEALFDTMIMEEMEGGQRERRKSYPVDTDDKKCLQRIRETRKKSAAGALTFICDNQEKPAKKTNWKLNYDVIIEESGIEPVSFTFKLNKAKKESNNVAGVGGVSSDNGKLDANHNVVVLESHDDKKKNNNKKHAVKMINKNQTNNNIDSDDVSMSTKKTKVVKKKIVVKKKVIKKKRVSGDKRPEQGKQTSTPAELPSKKKIGSKCEAVATATAAVITPFVRASFGKTFISPSQVSKTKSKFEKPKPKTQETPVQSSSSTPSIPSRRPSKSASLVSSSGDEDDGSSLDSDSSSSSSSTYYYDSDDYGDKRIACSISSFDSGLPSSPVPTTDPIGRHEAPVGNITNTLTRVLFNNIFLLAVGFPLYGRFFNKPRVCAV